MKSFSMGKICGVLLLVPFVACATLARSQQEQRTAADTASSVRELQDEVRQLHDLVEQMRAENAESRADMQRLRQDLQATRALLKTGATPPNDASSSATVAPEPSPSTAENPAASPGQSLEQRVEKLEESNSLINSKINDQYQTKVETASRYRARIHGIVLMNAFRNNGGSDNLDLPTYAEPVAPGTPNATFGATLRQSEIGLELFGPRVAGAKTSAEVQFDFAGGFPAAPNGVNFGIARLETASVHLDWEHTSVIAGQDPLFISPLSPTSFASLAIPAFSTAGNLWGWIPQIRIEHHFEIANNQTFTVQAGILDNLDWEMNYDGFNRTPQAGELSGQPAYAVRTAWSHPVHDQALSLGAAAYFGRQNWTFNRDIDAWSGMADWQIPLFYKLSLSGEFYRGRGIGGLGGGAGQSIVYGDNSYSYAPIRGVDSAGGWTQLRFQSTSKLQFNGAIGEDDAFADNIRGFASDANNGGTPGSILGRNRGALGNIIYRPRSDLIFAAEYRRLRTFPIYIPSSATSQINLSVGMLF